MHLHRFYDWFFVLICQQLFRVLQLVQETFCTVFYTPFPPLNENNEKRKHVKEMRVKYLPSRLFLVSNISYITIRISMRAQPCTFCSSTDFNMLLVALNYFLKHILILIFVQTKRSLNLKINKEPNEKIGTMKQNKKLQYITFTIQRSVLKAHMPVNNYKYKSIFKLKYN